MAVTKIKPIKSTLKKALEYIENPDKTDGKLLISSYGCSPETADIEFEFTLSSAIDKGNNLAHHLIQSFSPDENVTPKTAHEIGKKLAKKITKGQHEYVIATHIDKGHIHNHIIFCAVNFVEHRKYISNKKSYYNIRAISDELCREYGLSVVTPGNTKGKSFTEYHADKMGISYKRKLKHTVDILIPRAENFEHLLQLLSDHGYEIKRGKYVSCRSSVGERFTRLKTLGGDYTENAITERISGIKLRGTDLLRDSINLVIDIENCIKAQENRGYEHFAKINNLKQLSRTVNFLTENNIEKYSDLERILDEVLKSNDDALSKLKICEKKISEMALIIKDLSAYNETKDIYLAYRKSRNKQAFYNKYERDIIIHETAFRSLKERKISLNTDMETLKNQYNLLQSEKEHLYADYSRCRKDLKKYDIIKRNVDSILSVKRENIKSIDIEH